MKRITTILLLFIVIISSFFYFKLSKNSRNFSVKNSALNYKIDNVQLNLKKDWQKLSDKERLEIDKNQLAIFERKNPSILFSLKAHSIQTKEAQLNKVEQNLDKMLDKNFNSFNKINTRFFLVNNNKTMEYNFTFTQGKTLIKQKMLVIVGKSKVFYLNFWGIPKNMDQKNPEIQKIINNLKIEI